MTDPLYVLWATLSGHTGYHAFYCVDPEGRYGRPGGAWRYDVPAGDHKRFARMCNLGHVGLDVRVGAVPVKAERSREPSKASAVWARIETGEALTRLGAFKPEPTLLLREGGTVKHTALWCLSKPLPAEWSQRANERVTYRVKGRRADAGPGFAFHPPGPNVRAGRKKPVEVTVAGGSEEIYDVKQIVGRLKDAPALDGWRERKAA